MIDITLLFQITTIGIVTWILSTLLEQFDKKFYASAVTAIGAVLILARVIYEISRLFTTIRTMFQF